MEIENYTDNNTTYSTYLKYVIQLNIIYEKIEFFAWILTILIGIPGNFISILIFVKPCLNNKTNTGLLYTLLCTLNLLVILYNVLVTNSYTLFKYGIILPLRLDYFIQTILLQILSWSQVLITFDRFIAVVYPIKGVRIMSKKLVLYSIIIGMFVFIVGLNSTYFIRTSSCIFYNETLTIIDDAIMSNEIWIFTRTLKLLMQLFIPYLVMVILDFTVIIRMRTSKKGLSEGQNTNTSNKSSRFGRNTILIDLIYLIFNFPSTILDSYYTLHILFPNMLLAPVILEYILEIFLCFPYLYGSLLFVVFVTFNRIFRAEFIAILNQQTLFIFIKQIFV